MRSVVARLSSLLLLSPLGLALAMQSTAVVSTRDGPVRGNVADGINAYLGIPFAKPPVGALRWRAPEPASRWSSVRDATHFGANCSQSPGQGFGPYTAEFLITPTLPISEDCLFLNVWTPVVAGARKPVYVFIHGGGFSGGSGSIPIYNGSALAARGVVVVTFNYRLGIFGFLAHPELTKESASKTSGNYGIEDQIAALRWVHANIAQFGGDPDLVTISGQSAGAGSVHDLLVSKVAKGLFERAIAESGSGVNGHTQTLSEAESYGLGFEKQIGKSGIQSLRAMSEAELLKLTAFVPPTAGSPGRQLNFRPNVDGSVIAAAPGPRAALQSNVPFMTGFNASEGWPFLTPIATTAAFEADVNKTYGSFAPRLLAVYPHATDAEAAASAKMLGHDRTMASLLLFSQERAAAGEVVYTYVFDHPYPIPLTAQYGSFHTGEVPYVFGALTQEGRTFTASDQSASRQLQSYWVNFMLRGDPNGDDLARWPRAGQSEDIIMGLGDHVGPQPAVSSAERLRVWKEYFATDQPGA